MQRGFVSGVAPSPVESMIWVTVPPGARRKALLLKAPVTKSVSAASMNKQLGASSAWVPSPLASSICVMVVCYQIPSGYEFRVVRVVGAEGSRCFLPLVAMVEATNTRQPDSFAPGDGRGSIARPSGASRSTV